MQCVCCRCLEDLKRRFAFLKIINYLNDFVGCIHHVDVVLNSKRQYSHQFHQPRSQQVLKTSNGPAYRGGIDQTVETRHHPGRD